MRITVLIFFNPERAIFFFQLYAYIHIHINIIRIIRIVLYISVAELTQSTYKFPLAVNHDKDTKIIFLAYFKVISAKGGGCMNYAGSILSGNKISGHHSEWI